MDSFIKLIKNINDYIILNENRIVDYFHSLSLVTYKRDEKHRTIWFDMGDKTFKKSQTNKYLSIYNLQLLLNLGNKFLINKVLKNIDNLEFEYKSRRKIYQIRKIKNSIKRWFSRSQEDLNNLLELINKTYQNLDKTIIDKILWILDDYLDFTLSATFFSKLMKRYKDYLTSSKNWFIKSSKSYFEFSSYFNFITHLLFIEYYIPSLSKVNLVQLKEKFLRTLFKHLIILGTYDSEAEEMFYIQFKAIAYILFIFTVIKIRKNIESMNAVTIKNNMINLAEFARHIYLAENYFPGLFKKDSIISKTTALKIQRHIMKNKDFCLTEYEITMDALKELIEISRSYIYRTAYVGILSHSVLEEFILRELNIKDIKIEVESYINLPYSLHRADLLIKKAFIHHSKSKIEMDLVIDFTLTTENKFIIKKLFRNYQKSNRKLFIVLCSEDRLNRSRELTDLIEDLNFNYKENVDIITIEKFCEFFEIEINKWFLLDLFNKAIIDDEALRELEIRNTKCLELLDQYIL